MAVLGLHCCTLTFSSGRGQELLLLQYVGFSLQWLLLLQSTSSRHTGSSSWGTWAEQLGSWALEHICSMEWRNLPRSGIEPVSLALAGRFFTTEPLVKPWKTQVIIF